MIGRGLAQVVNRPDLLEIPWEWWSLMGASRVNSSESRGQIAGWSWSLAWVEEGNRSDSQEVLWEWWNLDLPKHM